MSLYQSEKRIYHVNRYAARRAAYGHEPAAPWKAGCGLVAFERF